MIRSVQEDVYQVDKSIGFDARGNMYAVVGEHCLKMPHKEASENVKICHDCKQHLPGLNVCCLFILKRDLVTGRVDYVPCSAARYDESKCGESAKRFVKSPTLWEVVVGWFSKNGKGVVDER